MILAIETCLSFLATVHNRVESQQCTLMQGVWLNYYNFFFLYEVTSLCC
jgi:hypothetical protein